MRRFHFQHILPLYAAFVVGRQLWMVMPYMAAGSVRSIMKREYPEGLDEVVIATIMQYVLLGLEYMHKNGGIHRDVKADNILIADTGHVCLADLGVAAARARNVSMINLDMTTLLATTFVGTPCWMAPEVMRQEEGYNTAADIWSFGITLLELAHGRPPLARKHPMRVLMDTISNPPPSLDDHATGGRFSRCLKDVIDACLQKDPTLRPSASTLLQHKFFKMAREEEFLVQELLSSLPSNLRCTAAFDNSTAAAAPIAYGQVAAAAKAAVGLKLQSGVGKPGALTNQAQRSPSQLRCKSGFGLQDFLGRMPSAAARLKSGWYFPPAHLLKTYQEEGGRHTAGEETDGIPPAAAAAPGVLAVPAAEATLAATMAAASMSAALPAPMPPPVETTGPVPPAAKAAAAQAASVASPPAAATAASKPAEPTTASLVPQRAATSVPAIEPAIEPAMEPAAPAAPAAPASATRAAC
eukprot:GHRR01014308.1.p1 GENE.GHRR01014308.1~~GHRR01014308.1.p1  ORF type:complete len:469 (+),score=168.70 GHRR01014308.1:365-1771(+)